MQTLRRARFFVSLIFLSCQFGFVSLAADTQEQFFEAKIRPLLVDRCVPCHGGEKPDAGLSLEHKEGWIDRDVIKLGSPADSSLIRVVRYTDEKLQMPPPNSGFEKLNETEVKLLEKWIADGAFDPRSSGGSSVGPKRRSKSFQINPSDLSHWAFQPVKADSTQSVDEVIEQQLRAAKIKRNPKATPRELVRRAYFDLWGLPPEPGIVGQFEQDHSQAAWSALIDRLLNSPYYGQRWGRYWLDWVRFAETNGYERDGLKPNAWRYRDYVIAAWNSDKPYDRFLTEQLAGDLLIQHEQLSPQSNESAWRDCIVATGYFRLHVWDDEPDSTEAAELDDLDDIMVTTGVSMLGLTIGCARCHDHKFDPISQVDYYSLLDLLRDIDPYGLSKKGGGGRGTGRIERFLADESRVQAWQNEQQVRIQQIEKQLQEVGDDRKEALKQELKKLRETAPPFEKALAIQAPPAGPKATHVLARGDYQSPGALVAPAVPQLFTVLARPEQFSSSSFAPQPTSLNPKVRNRLELANWITDKSNPLTARVIANRVWQKHMGTGIAPTTDDFGFTGLPPSNPALLDHLAHTLMASNWSIKSLHRTIMLSETYRCSSSNIRLQELEPNTSRKLEVSSDHQQASAALIDSDNRLFWRQNLRRLDAEAIRDSVLCYAGVLNDKSLGPSVYSTLSQEIRESANPVSLSYWGTSSEFDQNCRSVFLFVKRSLKDPLLESFDFANSHSPVGQRATTTVAPQALMMLNDGFMQKHAKELASRILSDASDDRQRAEVLWQIVLQRSPSERELEAVQSLINSKTTTVPAIQALELWTSLSRSILNSNEAIYID